MPSVADIARRWGPEYLRQFGAKLPPRHRQVLSLIAKCRTGELGSVIYHCEHCRTTHAISRSCGDRHCPTCQQQKTQAWQETQNQRLLPCEHFLLTFTLPASLRMFARAHQQACYEALFRASSQTLRVLLADPKHVGTDDPGFLGVLHTWGRDVGYHPHVHYIVPGGGLTENRTRWVSSRPGFLIPVKAASKIYRAKFRDEMRKAGLLDQIPASVWREAWVVHSAMAGDGQHALRYLSAYVFKVAISNHRIVSLADTPDGQGQVIFKYKKSGQRHWRLMTVSGLEFLRRFLQHVLPSGFQKVRSYGFWSARRKKDFENVRWLVTLAQGQVYELTSLPPEKPKPVATCATCGGALTLLMIIWPDHRFTFPRPRPPPPDSS